jgi:hypothetical protein
MASHGGWISMNHEVILGTPVSFTGLIYHLCHAQEGLQEIDAPQALFALLTSRHTV